MALTDVFVTQFLVQETEASVKPIRWQELDSGGYGTELNGIRIQMLESHSRTDTLLCLALISDLDKVYVWEPRSTAVFSRKYHDEDQRRLAESLHKLHKAVMLQCERRRQHKAAHAEEIREQILRRVVFGAEQKIDQVSN